MKPTQLQAGDSVLGFDPGPHNFGWALVHIVSTAPFRIKVVDYGQLTHTVHRFDSDIRANFSQEVKGFIRQYPEIMQLVMERFQVRPRGGRRGGILETANNMIGRVDEIFMSRKIPVELVMPSTWKNHHQRQHKSNMMGEMFRASPKYQNITDHSADALGMVLWHLDKHFGVQTLPLLISKWPTSTAEERKIQRKETSDAYRKNRRSKARMVPDHANEPAKAMSTKGLRVSDKKRAK